MTRQHSDDIEVLLDRARNETDRPPAAPRGTAPPGPAERSEPPPGYALRPNRPAHRRSVSAFNVMAVLFGAAVLIILYISNILRVNLLAKEVGDLQARRDSIQNTNAVLRAEINRKSTWERITALGTSRAGLTVPREQARAFSVDDHLARRAGLPEGEAP